MPTVARRRAASAAVVAAAAIAAIGAGGCGGSDDEPVRRAKPGRPSAAAKADLARPGSASATVQRFWGYVRDGALPGALDAYDPLVNRAIGVSDLSGALASERDTIASSSLNLIEVERARGGALI